MPKRPDTPAPTPGPLITGSYRQGPRFNTYRENGTHDWVLVYNLSGHAQFNHIKGNVSTGPGDMILLKPNTRHDYGTAKDQPFWEPLWAHFIPRPSCMEWLDWPEIAPRILLLHLNKYEQQDRIIKRFREMLRLNTTAYRQRETLAMNGMEEILLRCNLANPKSDTAHLDGRIRQSLDYICGHFTEPLTVGLIAEQAGLSPSRFAHLFRQQIRETPQRYLELQRLNRARQLLEFTQEPIRHIAQQVGFDNPFYFTLRFKQHHGTSPRLWRQQLSSSRATI